MKRTLSVSAAESRVLAVLWHEGPSTSDTVIAALAEERWDVSTIKTLLGRLVKKGAIRTSKQGRGYLYSAVLTRDQWITSESEGLLGRLFGGRLAPLVRHFSEHQRLSRADIAELKRLIGELDDE